MIGQMTITEIEPALSAIAKEYGLKLSRVKEFNIAKKLLSIRYSYYYNYEI
jgi:hypothetical protein